MGGEISSPSVGTGLSLCGTHSGIGSEPEQGVFDSFWCTFHKHLNALIMMYLLSLNMDNVYPLTTLISVLSNHIRLHVNSFSFSLSHSFSVNFVLCEFCLKKEIL